MLPANALKEDMIMPEPMATKADLERLGREADEEIRALKSRINGLTERIESLELWIGSMARKEALQKSIKPPSGPK